MNKLFEQCCEEVAKRHQFLDWGMLSQDTFDSPIEYKVYLKEAAILLGQKIAHEKDEKIHEQELIIYGIEEGAGEWKSKASDWEFKANQFKAHLEISNNTVEQLDKQLTEFKESLKDIVNWWEESPQDIFDFSIPNFPTQKFKKAQKILS